jgi:two-component system nitrate/nitrite response regulator NarL
MPMNTLILVAENRLFREGLCQVLASDALRVVGQASSVSEVRALVRSVGSADLVVYDAGGARPDFGEIKQLTEEFHDIGIVILAEHMTTADFELGLANGAKGFLPKSISGDALSLTLQLIALGENISTRPASVSHRSEVALGADVGPLAELRVPLSPRECAILDCLGEGSPNKVIARKLDIAEATVKVHIKSVLRKINVGNRTQAAIWIMNHRTQIQH